MIIRTYMAERAAASEKAAVPALSKREIRRLENSKYPEGKVSPVIPKKIVEEVKPALEEKEVRVETIEQEKSVVVSEPIENLDNLTAEPGTAVIRSKVLEEIEKNKTEQEKQPKKKYKIVSLGK